VQIEIEQQNREDSGQPKIIAGDRNVQWGSVMVHVIHKRNEKRSNY